VTGTGKFDHKAVVDGLFDGVYYVDLYRTIQYWNPAAERLTGYGPDRAVGTRCSDNLLMHVDADGNSLCRTACPLAHTMADGRVREARVYLHHRDGHRLPVTVRALPMRDRDGKMIGSVEVFSDATGEVRSHEKIEELERLVLLDALTELGNRRMAERLRRLVQESSIDVEGGQIAVTVTIGATLMRTGDTAASVVRRVDELLYAGKNGGRNTVMIDA
jgi:PAS domain S-box-containing protein